MAAKLKNDPADSPNTRLMKALRIGGKDLDLNRAGEISPSQQRKTHRTFVIYVLLTAVFVLVIEGYALQSILWMSSQERAASPFPLLLVLITLAVAGVVATVIYHQHKKVTTGYVIAFTGRVRKYFPNRLGKSSPSPLLIVINYTEETERIFPVTDGSYEVYIEDETYTVYSPSFAQDTIIAAEHVPGESIGK
jgi:hypothetical protein